MLFFQLIVEVEHRHQLQPMMTFWEGFSPTLADGTQTSWHLHCSAKEERVIMSLSLSDNVGVESLEHATQISECGMLVFNKLLGAPAFEFAWVNWDIDGETCDEIVPSLIGSTCDTYHGVVISHAVWERHGQPKLSAFRDGYFWKKHQGVRFFSGEQGPIYFTPACQKLWESLPS